MKVRLITIYYLMAVTSLSLTVTGLFASDEIAERSVRLKIIVYGSTGRVGSRVVSEALNRGHQVAAVSRDPSRVKQQHPNLTAVQGDILDKESVGELVAGQDVIVVSVRGSADNTKDPNKAVQRVAAELLVAILRDMGERAPRLIYVGGAGSLEVEPGVLYQDSIPRIARMIMPRSLRQEISGQVLTLEYLRTVDDVSWTYISPARKFEPGKRTGIFRIGGNQMLEDANGKSMISMEDFSVALIDEAESSCHVRTRFSVAY
jgi:uncharacterized protein